MAIRDGGEPVAHGPRRGDWWTDRRRVNPRIFTGMVLASLIFSVAPLANNVLGKPNKDYDLWYATGRAVIAGGWIYPKGNHLFPFMYPPSCAALLAATSLLGRHGFLLALVLVNAAAWVGAVVLAVYLATGKAWRQHPLLYLVPTLCVSPFIHDTFLLGQPNLLLLTLMLGAFACLRHGFQGRAGALIALAAGIKAFPVMALGYLVYRRLWKATLALVATLAFLLLVLPLPLRGPARAWDDLVTWTRGMVLKYDEGGIAQRPERCYSFKNQSLVALANRLLRPIRADGESDDTWKVNLARLDFRTVNRVIVLAAGLLCAFYVAVMPRRGRRTGATDAIEAAMLLLLILMFSPLSFNYFFVWLIYPLTLVLHLLLAAPRHSPRRAAVRAWFAAVVLLLALPIAFLREAQAYGNLFFASLLLLVGLGYALRHPEWMQEPPASPAPHFPTSLRSVESSA